MIGNVTDNVTDQVASTHAGVRVGCLLSRGPAVLALWI
jgi:hypothetical protein